MRGDQTRKGRRQRTRKGRKRSPEIKPRGTAQPGTPTDHYQRKQKNWMPAARKMRKQNWAPRMIAKKLGVPRAEVEEYLRSL